jgi:hypothetical protein
VSADLSPQDRCFVQEFVETADSMEDPQRRLATVSSAVLIVCGMILGGYAAYLFTTNPSDRIARFVLLPGVGGGLGLAALGVLIPRLCSHCEEKKRLGAILTKLLGDNDSAGPPV